MRKIIPLILVSMFLLTTVLAGCGSQNAPNTTPATTAASTAQAAQTTTASAPVHIRMANWAPETEYKTLIDYLTTKGKENNIDFEYQYIDNSQYDNVLNTQFAAGQGPDVLMVGGSFLAQANAGYLMDLTGQPFIDKYTDTSKSGFTIDGKIYAIPSVAFYGGIFYNKKIFADNGIDVPKTWDDFMAIGSKIKDKSIKPFVVGVKTYGIPSWTMFGVLNSNFYNTASNMTFDENFNKGTAKAADAWLDPLQKYWSQMITKGYITKDMVGLDDTQATNEFATGKAAMLPGGPWYEANILKDNPNLDFAMFPYPSADGSTGWMVGAAGNGFSVNAAVKPENKDAALKILDLLSTPEGQQPLIDHDKGPSGLKGMTFTLGDRYVACSDAINEGHIYATWVHWVNSGPLLDSLSKDIQLYVSGSETLDKMLQDFDSQNADLVKANAQ